VGILCVELLRASGFATPLAATNNTTGTAYPPVQLSRSDVVQTLTLVIGFLDWIRPTDNNAHLYGKFKKVVKRIIDIVFDSPPPRPNHTIQEEQNRIEIEARDDIDLGNQGIMEGLEGDFDPALMLMDDLDWLNTIDWTEGHWS